METKPNRRDLTFSSHGRRLAAWLYLPPTERAPLVIMAHGFAAERSFRLPAFAERFVEKGLAALVFDYRNFGASEGEPRNLVSPGRHLDDWRAALAFARTLPEVDSDHIALWGSSFSGGHVIVTAAADQKVSAVVAQVPFVDGVAVARSMPLGYTVAGMAHGVLDLLAALAGRAHCVPVVEEPRTFGLMNTAESKPGYLALVPPDSAWQNQAPARVVFSLPWYRPVKSAPRVNCPALLIGAEQDSLIAIEDVEKCAGLIKGAEFHKLPVGHFDVYAGEWFEKVAALETEFLTRCLLEQRS